MFLAFVAGWLSLGEGVYKYPAGIRVELVAVNDPPNHQSWDAVAHPRPRPFSLGFEQKLSDAARKDLEDSTRQVYRSIGAKVTFHPSPKRESRSVYFRVTTNGRTPEDLSARFRPFAGAKVTAQGTWLNGTDWFADASFEFAGAVPSRADIQLGVSVAPWKTVAARRFGRRSSQSGTLFAGKPELAYDVAGKLRPGFWLIPVVVPKKYRDDAVEYRAYDRQGNPMAGAGSRSLSPGSGSSDVYFRGDPRQLSRIDLRVRPLHWQTLKGIPLWPASS